MKPVELQHNRPAEDSICLVVCYFGGFPSYFQYVLRSCASNPDIDWLIVTDDASSSKVPSNVHIHQTTLSQLREVFSAKLGFEVIIGRSYEICDFRPAFGFLFSESLADYSFWGHCDLDMIFGDVRKFLRKDILSKYDRILDLGHLSLYRNTDKVNRYFMLEAPKVPTYREVFGATKGTAWDEWRGIYRILRYHDIPQYHADVIVDVAPPTRWKYSRFEGIGIKNYPFQFFYWYRGRVFQCYLNRHGAPMDVEYAYIHFQKRHLPAPQFDPYEADGFLITPDGFFPYSREEFTKADFCRYNQDRFRPLPELLNAAYRSLRRRLGLEDR